MKFDQLRDCNRNIFTEKSYIKCGQERIFENRIRIVHYKEQNLS